MKYTVTASIRQRAGKRLATARLRRIRLAALSLLTAALVPLTGTPAHAAWADLDIAADYGNGCNSSRIYYLQVNNGTAGCDGLGYDMYKTFKGNPAVAPWVPYVAWDCTYWLGLPSKEWPKDSSNPWGYRWEMAPTNCSFKVTGGTPQIVLGAPVRVSASNNNCGKAASTISHFYSTTVTNSISDMYGSQTVIKAEVEIGKIFKLAIEQAFQYQKTVTASTAVTTTNIHTFTIEANKRGYVAFSPRLAAAKGVLTATYSKPSHGSKTWSDSNITTGTPIYIPGTNFADGEYSVVYEPC
ncbi:hypothetical protein ACIRU3_47280 [Streptomyces sp. NPDC101151]|uniref:hypothetical protein n=1 Tax=Streptomyces sp. NPDC101151 TaxID=3366115 RepID=UPI0037FD5AF0